MKRNLLVLAALLTGSCAMAQEFTATWERPVPTEFAEWQPETTFYMYNVDGGGFYIAYQGGGPDDGRYWQTRSSVNDTIGAEVKFTRTNPDATVEEIWDGVADNAYLLTSYVPKHKGFYCTFCTGVFDAVWSDNNRNYDRAWNVILNGDGSFYLEGNEEFALSSYDYTDKYLGVWAADPEKVLYLKDADYIGVDAVFYDKWKVMTPEQYENYIVASKVELKRVEAALALRKAIEDAQAKNPEVDYSKQIAVYNNMESTTEELLYAIESLSYSLIDELVQGATVDNPADLTQLIANPTFDGMVYTGWQGDLFGAGGDVDEVAEHFNRNFNTYQTIMGLPAGVYKVNVNGFYRAGWLPKDDYAAVKTGQVSNARLYMSGWTLGEFSVPVKHITEAGLTGPMGVAGVGMDTETEFVTDDGSLWFPHSMMGANAYFHNENAPGLYLSTIAGAIAEGDTLRFGVKKSVTIQNDWSVFDDFQLYYYGNSAEAYKMIVENTLETNAIDITAEGLFYGQAEYEAFASACNALQESATIESIVENLPKVTATRQALSVSIDAYSKYIATIVEIETWLSESVDIMGEDADKLSDYIFSEDELEGNPHGNVRHIIPTYDDNNGGGILSVEEILAEIDYVLELKANAIRNSLHDGTDLSDLIKNNEFNETSAAGWLMDTQYPNNSGVYGTISSWHGGSDANWVAEAYNHKFDVYQEIEGLTNGLYELSVHAFYRTGYPAEAYDAWKYQTGDEKVTTVVYLNEFATPIRNLMEVQFAENLANNCWADPDGFYHPNGMASAALAFSLEDESMNFKQKVYGLVTDGKLRVGIRNTDIVTGKGMWTLFDKFKLTFRAKNEEALETVINNYADRAYLLADETFGHVEYNSLFTSVEEAETAKTSDEQYDALIKLVECYNKATECLAAYKQLSAAIDEFNNVIIEVSTNDPTNQFIGDASDFYDEVNDMYGNQEYSATEALAAIEKIEEWKTKLRLPSYATASDENPVDMTSAIINPSFDIVNDFTGWMGDAFGTGGDAGANAEHYQRNFDSYQIITGLPAGTYELSVKGMYRHGHADQDYAHFMAAKAQLEANPDYTDPTLLAFLYAETPSAKVSAAVDHTCDGGKATPDFSSLNAAELTTDGPCYVANSRTSADLYFHDETAPEAYLTKVVFTIKEGEPLRIGVTKIGDVLEGCWSIFDDFRLTYFGAESSKTQSGNAVAIESVDATPSNATVVGIYSANGVQLKTAQRGINIIRMSNGTVRKVYVK